ncbi:hypothetical protein [Brevundimonas sp.]|uniref:hypothetical protein n=1 Tax=Brevundimonas sp. TaxID=1871086 RepID=UPI003BAA8CD9
MGTFRGCIDEAVGKGEITAEVADRARKTYDEAHASASEAFGPVDADRQAADAVIRQLELDAVEAKRRRALMLRSRQLILDGVAEYKKARGYVDPDKIGARRKTPGLLDRMFGRKPPGPPDGFADEGVTPDNIGPGGYDKAMFGRALELLVENKPGLSGAPFSSIEGRYRAIRGQADAMMASVIERFESRTGFDKPGRADLTNLVREAFGEDTGDAAAKMLASAWTETAEHLRLKFNAAGGSIGKIDNWGMPQAHDSHAVRAAGRERWISEVLPRLDRARMIDETTGLPFTETTLARTLGNVWYSIATNGADKSVAQSHTGLSALAKRRNDSRFLIFKSADDWMAYQQAFGDADPFSTMMGHIDEMSRDTAQMHILGPNPSAQWDWLTKAARREAALEEAAGVKGAVDTAESYVSTAETMLEHFTGSLSTPVNSRLAQFGASARAMSTAAQLGSAIISDIPTAPVYGAYARAFSGLSRTGDMGRLMSLLNPVDGSGRHTARRSGFIIENATDGMLRATQDNLRLLSVGERMDGNLNAFARRAPVAVMRVQGMTAWDAGRKRSFQGEFMGALHDRRDKSIAALASGDSEDKAFAIWLKARGFTEADWSTIRSAPVWEPKPGVQFLRPTDVPDQTLALRLSEAVDIETRLAVPQGSLWTRAKLLGETRPGTVAGEMRRSWAQFRSFSLTASHLWYEELALRGQAKGMTPLVSAAAGIAPMVMFLTIGGALSIQLREITKGNEPKPMNEPRFWMAAMLQGGGLGVLNDAIYASESRNGKTSQAAAFGPGGQMVADAWDATIGNAVSISEGVQKGKNLDEAVGDANIGRDGTNLLRSWVPGANLWFSRAAYNRLVVDEIQRLVDPEAEEDFQRRRQRMKTQNGQDQWWATGERVPG